MSLMHHLSGKVLLGEEEGLEDDPETRSEVSTTTFTGRCAVSLAVGLI